MRSLLDVVRQRVAPSRVDRQFDETTTSFVTMNRLWSRRVGAVIAALSALAMPACKGNEAPKPTDSMSSTPRVLHVPAEYATIQQAVDEAHEGDRILIAAGVYPEAVTIEKPRITLRGEDRNAVVVDGEFKRENGIAVYSDGGVVENLTIKNHRGNGVFFSGSYQGDTAHDLVGYRASYLTVANNGLYGVYAFGARGGMVDHIYGSGQGDAAVYIGQCDPCDAVVTDSVGELNAIGVQTANASTDLWIVNSTWSHNRVGVNLLSNNREKRAPQRGVTVAGNVIDANSDPRAARGAGGFGYGITVAGGRNNVISKNKVTHHLNGGIVLTQSDGFRAENNRVTGNTSLDNGVDIVAASTGPGNCVEANVASVVSPQNLLQLLACATSSAPVDAALPPEKASEPGAKFEQVPPPGPQITMPQGADAPWLATQEHPALPTIDQVSVPT